MLSASIHVKKPSLLVIPPCLYPVDIQDTVYQVRNAYVSRANQITTYAGADTLAISVQVHRLLVIASAQVQENSFVT